MCGIFHQPPPCSVSRELLCVRVRGEDWVSGRAPAAAVAQLHPDQFAGAQALGEHVEEMAHQPRAPPEPRQQRQEDPQQEEARRPQEHRPGAARVAGRGGEMVGEKMLMRHPWGNWCCFWAHSNPQIVVGCHIWLRSDVGQGQICMQVRLVS